MPYGGSVRNVKTLAVHKKNLSTAARRSLRGERLLAVQLLALSEDVVHNTRERLRGVDHGASRQVLFGSMQIENQLAFRTSPLSGPLIVWSPVKPTVQGLSVDVQHENCIEEVDELVPVPGSATEEGHGIRRVGDERIHLGYGPAKVLGDPLGSTSIIGEGRWGSRRHSGRGIASVLQLPVTVDGLVAPSLQLAGDRGLATAGNTVYQEVPPTHCLTV
jgi:hypothetical protein